jgi:hypothetical protein
MLHSTTKSYYCKRRGEEHGGIRDKVNIVIANDDGSSDISDGKRVCGGWETRGKNI